MTNIDEAVALARLHDAGPDVENDDDRHPVCRKCKMTFYVDLECEPCALCSTCTHAAFDGLATALLHLAAEVERLKGCVLRPLTEREIEQALHEGRAEAMSATGDNAWSSLLDDRDRLRAEVEKMRPDVEAAMAWKDVADDPGAPVWKFTMVLDAAIGTYRAGGKP